MAGKLGRLPAIPDRPKLRLSDVLREVPDHPIIDIAPTLTWPMDLNDKYGDCVVAGSDHALQAIHSQLVGPYANWTDEQLIAFYKTQNPDFDPSTDANDNGMVIQLFLEYLRKQGHILAFAAVDPHNSDEVRAAVYLFLAVLSGETLDQAQLDQFDKNQPWDVVANSPSEGGHCTCWVGYDNGQLSTVTWGKLQPMTDAFRNAQVDEAWVVVTQDHLTNPSFRAGIDADKLAAAFQEITGEPFPVAPQPPQPPQPQPSPTPDPASADATFVAALKPWVARRHEGMNHHVALAAQAWMQARGYD